MKNLFSAILILVSLASYGQKDVNNLIVNQDGYKESYTPGDTVVIYFDTNNSTGTDMDSVVISWYRGNVRVYYKVVLSASLNSLPNGYSYVTKFVIPSDFWTQSYIMVGYLRTPKLNISGLSAVISATELSKKELPVDIFTTNGQLISKTTSSKYKESLPSGVYLFYAIDHKITFTGKFIVD